MRGAEHKRDRDRDLDFDCDCDPALLLACVSVQNSSVCVTDSDTKALRLLAPFIGYERDPHILMRSTS